MKKTYNGIITIAALLATISSTIAAPQLRLSDGTTTITVVDGDANDQSPDAGVVYYNGPVGSKWNIDVTIGVTKPANGTPGEPYMDLNTFNQSTVGADLTLEYTDTNFTATSGTWETDFGGTSDGTVEFLYYMDSSNTPFGTNGLLADFPGNSVGYSGSSNGTFSITAPYSITVAAKIHHNGTGTTGFDSQLTLTPPQQQPPTVQCAGDRDLGCNPASIPSCDTNSITVTASCGVSNITCAAAGPDIITGCIHERDIVYTVTDNCGQSASCTQHIYWTADLNPPSFTNCPGDKDMGCNPTSIPDCDLTTVSATDDCGRAVVTCGSVDSADGCGHTRTITYTATDACGNKATCVQHITWTVNSTPPSLTVQDITNSVCGTTCTTVTYSATATDGCGNATITYSPASGSQFCLGTNTVTATATDGCGNKTVKTFKIIIIQSPNCGGSIGHGDTATIGFWHNKNGQALINAMPQPGLGNWLASNYPCMFGNLAGKSNSVVAAQFLTYFTVTGQKTYAQVMAGALADYVTSTTLSGGTKAGGYGFNTSPGGTGSKTFNVGSNGTALGLSNNTSYTVAQLLSAAQAKCPWSSTVFNALNAIFDGINQGGDIN